MKRITRKRVAVLLMIVALIVTQIPPYEARADVSDFVVEGTTLIKYEGKEPSVTIPNYIETIGREAFENNGSLVSVQLSDSVVSIEAGAFARCKNLCQVSVPASVSYIAPSAFAGCERLANLSIDKENTFYRCTDGTLTNYKGTRLVQVLSGRVGNSEKSYTIPSAVEDIDRYAFWGCKNIEKIQLNQYMRKVPAYAFANMENLSIVSIPNQVTEIEMKAFEDCVALEEVYIAPSVVRIHDTAFDGCKRLKILSEPGTAADFFYQSFVADNATLTELEDGETGGFYLAEENQEESAAKGTQTMSDQATAFYANVDNEGNAAYMEQPDEGNLLGRTKIVDGRAVVFVDNSKVQVYDKDSSGSTVKTADGQESPAQDTSRMQGEETDLLGEETTALGEEITNKKYVVMNGSIADRAFYGETGLEEYQIPAGVERIGDFSFARSGLTSIRIPNGVKSIGYGAFYNCTKLSTIYIPTSVTEIESAAFTNTAWLDAWMQGGSISDFLVVGDGILLAYKGFQSHVTIPENVKVIGAEAFKNHTEIEDVYLPDSVKRVEEEAFYGCSSLRNVAGGSKVEEIKDRAFYGCSIQTVRIPETVKSIGLLAYGNMSGTDCVVFLADEIPKLSYEKTATRLSNAEYRKPPFEGIHVFVVPSSAKNFENTVLMDGEMGFDGIICSVMKEPTLQEKGEVDVRRVSTDEQGNGVPIPDSVWIYQKEYYVTNVETDAIPSRKEAESAENPSGLGESTVTETENIPETDSQDQDVHEEDTVSDNVIVEKQGNLAVNIKKESWKEDAGIYGDMTTEGAGYQLVISDSEENPIKDALSREGIETDDFTLIPFELEMVETRSRIPISRLGSERVTVSLPVPRAFQEQPVVAVCLDDSGQLEYISCIHHTEGEGEYVRFDVKHFSSYALLCGEKVPTEYRNAYYEKVAAKKAANYSSKYGKKDDSPDTGDLAHPKWFLAAGLFFLAVYLCFAKLPVYNKMK